MQYNSVKEQRLLRMVEEIEDYAFILLDESGNIDHWNKGAEKIKGYLAEEILGKSFREFYPAEAKGAGLPEQLLAEARQHGRSSNEGWRVRQDGSRFWANVVITAIHDEAGAVIGFTKVTKDLTQQKLAMEELRKSEERFHQMVNDVEDYAILMLDPEGTVVNWNKGAEKIKGYKSEEIVGKNFRLFYREEDRRSRLPERLIAEATAKGRAQHEGWRVRKDGTLFWGNVTITALFGENNEVIGFSKVTRDLTDRKKAEAAHKLEIKNKELEQFTYVASHDLREPLNTIRSFVDLLGQDFQDKLSTDGAVYLNFINQSLTRMESLIKDLLDYSRLGADRSLEKVDCQSVLDEVLMDLAGTITSSQATVRLESSLPVVNGYKTELRQLFQNLLSNALKFRSPDRAPVIRIWAVEEYEHWRFVIQDNGIGIPPQYYERIFLLFQRLHQVEAYEGTGIGLTYCKKIVEMHDGKIWVESEPGNGSIFYFTLSKLW